MNEQKLKRAVIKEELVALTGDYIKAILLNQLIYWSEHMRGVDLFIKEEQERLSNHKMPYGDFECSRGWIYKKAEELSSETMLNLSPQTIHRNLTQLIESGFISKRNNPKYKWDRTIQYRVNIAFIQHELNKIGYNLDGYSFSNLEDGISKMEYRSMENGTAIPEITTENKTETTVYITLPSDDNFLNLYKCIFFKFKRKQHPKITEEQLWNIKERIEKLKEYGVEADYFEKQTYEHFETLPKTNNGNILAFLTAMRRYFDIDIPNVQEVKR